MQLLHGGGSFAGRLMGYENWDGCWCWVRNLERKFDLSAAYYWYIPEPSRRGYITFFTYITVFG